MVADIIGTHDHVDRIPITRYIFFNWILHSLCGSRTDRRNIDQNLMHYIKLLNSITLQEIYQ